MTYRTRFLIARIAAGVAVACLVAVLALSFTALTYAFADMAMLGHLAIWMLVAFVVGAVAGVPVVILWPTTYERQHAVRGAERPADEMNALLRRITPAHHR